MITIRQFSSHLSIVNPFFKGGLLWLALCLPGLSSGQSIRVEETFPTSWTGVWTGELTIYNAQGKAESVPMQLRIFPLDSIGLFTWTIIYGSDRVSGMRPYLLRTIDAARGYYAIDEQNSIILENYLLGNKLVGRFEVQGKLLLSTVEKQGDTLVYEILSGDLAPVSTTGNQVIEGEAIPLVKAYPLAVRQFAILQRAGN